MQEVPPTFRIALFEVWPKMAWNCVKVVWKMLWKYYEKSYDKLSTALNVIWSKKRLPLSELPWNYRVPFSCSATVPAPMASPFFAQLFAHTSIIAQPHRKIKTRKYNLSTTQSNKKMLYFLFPQTNNSAKALYTVFPICLASKDQVWAFQAWHIMIRSI